MKVSYFLYTQKNLVFLSEKVKVPYFLYTQMLYVSTYFQHRLMASQRRPVLDDDDDELDGRRDDVKL